MIIDPREILKLTRELITELRELRVSVDRFTDQLKTLEVKQDALDMEIGSLAPPKESPR
jgi:vacuolar-type H+-ATPase subunit D/Vma8